MRTIPFLLALLASAAVPAAAQYAGQYGTGIIVGNPTGITGKIWTSHSQAIDLGLGFGPRVAVYADYLVHGWGALPQPASGRFPVYFGVGAQFGGYLDATIGVRAVVGLAFWFSDRPLEIFAEAVPVYRVALAPRVRLGGGLGVRYYFPR